MTENVDDFVRTKPGYGRITEQFGGMQSDVIESMATIGAGRVWRRTGRVVYATGWEISDVDWWDASAVGGSVGRTELYAHRGGACLELIPPPDAGVATVERRGPFIPTTRQGLEVSVWMTPNTSLFGLEIIVHEGLTRYIATLSLGMVLGNITITVPGDTPKIDDMRYDWRDINMNFHNVKLVVDLETKMYEGLYIDDRKWDLSAHEMWQGPIGLSYYIQLDMHAYDFTEAQSPVYVDDFIHTIDEPEGLFKGH